MRTDAETQACRKLLALALEEDLADRGDLTSAAVIPASWEGRAIFTVRQAGVVAGLPILELVYGAINPQLQVESFRADGTAVAPGDHLAIVTGPMRGLLTGERTALNFLQRLSGVATLTRRFVDAITDTKARILDTRKTTPGWRILEKYAVRCGGGQSHRLGLFDGVLIKDNHLAAFRDDANAIRRAVEMARSHVGPAVPVEIEVDTLEQFEQALACHPDIILLDNMPAELLLQAVQRRDAKAPAVLLEASGGIRLLTIAAIAATGVDRISVGALTHSATALDIGLDYHAN